MLCALCNRNEASVHHMMVVDGQKGTENVCLSCFAKQNPEVGIKLSQPWVCNYCGGPADMYDEGFNMFLHGQSDNMGETMCESCFAAISDDIQRAISAIDDIKGDKDTTKLVFEAVENARKAAKK